MNEQNIKILPPLNNTDFFCECGIGPAGNCLAPHVIQELRRPSSPTRHYAYLIAAIVVFAVVWFVWR